MWVYHDIFWYLTPDQRFLKWIRIRPSDTDLTGSGSETLFFVIYAWIKLIMEEVIF